MDSDKIDFSYINMLAENDPGFKKEYVSTFEKTFRELLSAMLDHLKSGNSEKVGELAHQLKPSGKMIKLTSVVLLEEIQHNPSICTEKHITSIRNEFEEALLILKDWVG